jgi:hypothetical protein
MRYMMMYIHACIADFLRSLIPPRLNEVELLPLSTRITRFQCSQ